ncbi:hypothetical protein C8F01DRAFT_1108019 [Mycena amicta]|nr:hypothetical protein C8F01DRAFT_1108019 [Mycena amicta]
MTSRVQKGGPVFKPVIKARARATSNVPRSIPVPPPGRDSDSVAPTSSMPPPPVPVRPDDSFLEPFPASRIAAPPLISKAPTPLLAPRRAPPTIATTSTQPPASSSTLVGSSPPLPSSSLPSNGPDIGEVLTQPSIGDPNNATPSAPIQKKTRKRKKQDDEAETTEGETAPKRKKSGKKTAKKVTDDTSGESQPRPRRKRKPAEPVTEEGNIDSPHPGEELDPTTVTMAELCEDNGQGRVSSKAMEIQQNHFAWKQQGKERRARMKLIAERKKYGRPEEEEEEEAAVVSAAAPADNAGTDVPNENVVTENVVQGPSEPVIVDESGNDFDYSRDLASSRFHVQVRIGPNGETIIDEDSLTVDRAEEVDTSNYVHVVESDQTKFVNSASYTKKCRGSRWSAEETELFYEALAQHGENYELISLVLPGRSRTACKNKFKAEDKKDTARINRCLESRLPIDMNTLSRLTGRDFSGPTPVIKMPSPPPAPDKSADPGMEPETPATVRKRSRSRPLPAADGVEIIADAASYNDLD